MESSLTERATWRDYYELCKPNVVWLMILIGFGSVYSQFRVTSHSQGITGGDALTHPSFEYTNF